VEFGLYRTEPSAQLDLESGAIWTARLVSHFRQSLETFSFGIFGNCCVYFTAKTILKIAIKSTRKANINTIQTLDHDFVILVKIIFRNF